MVRHRHAEQIASAEHADLAWLGMRRLGRTALNARTWSIRADSPVRSAIQLDNAAVARFNGNGDLRLLLVAPWCSSIRPRQAVLIIRPARLVAAVAAVAAIGSPPAGSYPALGASVGPRRTLLTTPSGSSRMTTSVNWPPGAATW